MVRLGVQNSTQNTLLNEGEKNNRNMSEEEKKIKQPPGSATTAMELLRQGQNVRFSVKGKSMSPFVQKNDTVHLCPVSQSYLRPGMLV